MVGNGVENRKQGDGESDEKDNRGDKETAVAELPGKVLFLVRSAASTNETNRLTGLIVASGGGRGRVDAALSGGASTKVLPGAVGMVCHVEGTQLPSRGVVRGWMV